MYLFGADRLYADVECIKNYAIPIYRWWKQRKRTHSLGTAHTYMNNSAAQIITIITIIKHYYLAHNGTHKTAAKDSRSWLK